MRNTLCRGNPSCRFKPRLSAVAAAGRFAALHTVDIADVIAGRPEEEALAVLRALTDPLRAFKVALHTHTRARAHIQQS